MMWLYLIRFMPSIPSTRVGDFWRVENSYSLPLPLPLPSKNPGGLGYPCHSLGGDHGSASVIKQYICGLICGVGWDAVTNYVMAWHGALRWLDGTSWDFTAFD